MENIYGAIVIFILVYLTYYLFIIINPKHLNKYMKQGKETTLIRSKYKLNYDLHGCIHTT